MRVNGFLIVICVVILSGSSFAQTPEKRAATATPPPEEQACPSPGVRLTPSYRSTRMNTDEKSGAVATAFKQLGDQVWTARRLELWV